MPFIQDERPPVSADAIESARAELPREYGVRVIEERGRRMLIARVPRAKPDYNYELADVALYTSLTDLKDVKDVIMVGDEKVVRMEPVRLRDHVREQIREDADVAKTARASLPRAADAWTVITSASNHSHRALVLRLPVATLAEATADHFHRARAGVGNELVTTLRECQFVYFVSDSDHGRVGRRIFVENLCPELADAVAPRGGETANPIHLRHQTPGGTLKQAY